MAHILVIDDDRMVRELVKDLLEDAGYSVTLARDGEEGIRMFDEAGADLVITEIIMPVMDGIAVLRELRHQNPDQPLIAVSGGGRYVRRDYLPTAIRLGANRTLAKPFRAEDLLSVVREVLQGPRLPEAASASDRAN